MRVLLVTSMFPPYAEGGVSSHVRDLATALARRGEEVRVLTSRRRQSLREDEGNAVPPSVRATYRPSFLRLFPALRRSLKSQRFDVVHFHCFNALAFAPLARRHPAALVFTLHSDSANYLASVRGWPRWHPAYRLLLRFERRSIRWADATIGVSRRMVEYARGIGGEAVVRIPNAVDASWWSPGPRNGGAPTLLVPRMHVPKNGIEYALKAMRGVLLHADGATLLVTGDGPLRPSLERRAREIAAENIRFLGMVGRERLRDLYRSVDAVVIPSVTVSGTQENTSIAALEAMACGTPVIATDIGGLPEVVEDGRGGILVPERDPEAIGEAAVRLLTDEAFAARMREEARRRVIRGFSLEAWGERVLEAYALARERRQARGGPFRQGEGP